MYLNTLDFQEIVFAKIIFKLKQLIEVVMKCFFYKALHKTEATVCRDSFPFFNIKICLGWDEAFFYPSFELARRLNSFGLARLEKLLP